MVKFLKGPRARVLALLLLFVPVVALILTMFNDEYQEGVADAKKQAEIPVALNVALVNEDHGAVFQDEQLNLGRSFVKQVESDTTCTWHVVSRGTAESGLTLGKFNLLVLIPSEFSAKLLDINSANPAPIGVTYQINANGNSRVETASNVKGQEIVTKLNRQLVDMYVASILGNLYTAQENVKSVVSAEDKNAGVLAGKVDPAAKSFGDKLGGLTYNASSLLTTNENFAESLGVLDLSAQGSITGQTSHEMSLAELLEARRTGAMTYANFLETVMTMDSALLSSEVQSVYDDMVAIGAAMTEQVDPEAMSGNHAEHVTQMQTSVEETATSVEERITALESLTEEDLLTNYKDLIYAALDADANGVITLGEFLKDVQGDAADGPLTRVTEQLDAYEVFRELLKTTVEQQIARLPYRTQAELDEAQERGDFSHAEGQFTDLPNRITGDLAAITDLDGYAGIGTDPELVGSDLGTAIEELNAALTARVPVPEPTPSPSPTATDDPSGEPDPEPDPDPTATPTPDPCATSGTPSPSPTEPSETDPPTGDPTPDPTDDPTQDPVDCGPVQPDPYRLDVARTSARYGAVVTQIDQAYVQAAALAELLKAYPPVTDSILDLDVTATINSVITNSVAQQLAEDTEYMTKLTEISTKLETSSTELQTSYQELTKTTTDLMGNITRQLESLEGFRTSMAQIRESELGASQSTEQADAMTQAAAAEARELVSASQDLSMSSQQNLTQAEQIKNVLASLNTDVEGLLGQAEDLNLQSDMLVAAVKDQVKNSKEFSESFSGVLANSHSSGVLNEGLMRFLAGPVQSNQRAAIASADVTRPFPWVLMLFSLCFIVAYTLATLVRARKEKSAFARKQRWYGTNLGAMAVVTLAALAVGAAIAWLGGKDLGIIRESLLLWAACIGLIALQFAYLFHWFIKQFGTIGVGVCVLLLVSYVFVSNAVGAASTVGGIAAVAVEINPLCRAEAMMMDFLTDGSVGTAGLGVLGASIIVLGLFNLLVQEAAPKRAHARPKSAPKAPRPKVATR